MDRRLIKLRETLDRLSVGVSTTPPTVFVFGRQTVDVPEDTIVVRITLHRLPGETDEAFEGRLSQLEEKGLHV